MNSKKNRLVAIILFKNGNVVQSKLFKQHKIVGDPYVIVDRLSSWNADEVIYLNIRPNEMNITRQDKNLKYKNSFDNIIEEVSKRAFMPLTVGGGIKTIKDAKKYFEMGADKISINSQIYYDPKLILECAKVFGSQSIVASIDINLIDSNSKKKIYSIFVDGGKKQVPINLRNYLKKIEDIGAGEILLNAIHKDGTLSGFDLDLIDMVKNYTKLPIIVSGGAGSWDDFYICAKHNVDAIAASNIFHFFENSYYEAMQHLNNKGCNFRPPMMSKLTKSKI
jgi:cyclase